MRVNDALVYIATLGNPEEVGMRGMPIREFAQGDVPMELRDLEIYQIDPLRPLTILINERDPTLRKLPKESWRNFRIKMLRSLKLRMKVTGAYQYSSI